MRLIIGISGATGAIYGIRLLEVLAGVSNVETHLVITEPGKRIIQEETSWTVATVQGLASYVYDNQNIGATISSGSFNTAGMIVLPCSIKTMSAIATSYDENLLTRAADVTVKEGRKLVLGVRETPLHLGHLQSLAELSQRRVIILPLMPAFYHHPKTIDDIVNQIVGTVLDLFGIEHSLFDRWAGLRERDKKEA